MSSSDEASYYGNDKIEQKDKVSIIGIIIVLCIIAAIFIYIFSNMNSATQGEKGEEEIKKSKLCEDMNQMRDEAGKSESGCHYGLEETAEHGNIFTTKDKHEIFLGNEKNIMDDKRIINDKPNIFTIKNKHEIFLG